MLSNAKELSDAKETIVTSAPVASLPIITPGNQNFASEVKLDRLNTLWRVTLFVVTVVGWLILNFAVLQRNPIGLTLVPFILVGISCLVVRSLLRRARYVEGAWVYSLSLIASIGCALAFASDDMLRVLSFAFPIIVFVVGMLLRPGNTLSAAVLSAFVIIAVPAITRGTLDFFSIYQVAAIILTFLSALLAIQITSDLFQISEWALTNYQRERRVSGELYDNRAQLEKAFLRTQALGEDLQKTNAQLDQARTTAEEAKHYRGQFLANMSHELRTPLNAIIGFSETMLKFPAMYDGVRLPNTYEADLQQIYNSGRQLLTLINDILDLSKVDAGKMDIRMGAVELKSLVTHVAATASGLIGVKVIRLETDIADGLPLVWADRARVGQVLLNLYSNAAKFTDQGLIRLTVKPEGNFVHLAMTDTGGGIAPHNLEIIFEEFKQAEGEKRDPRSGAGLGLAISRQLLSLMGGTIWAESEMGVGSTFHVLLPVDTTPLIPEAVTPAPQPVAQIEAILS